MNGEMRFALPRMPARRLFAVFALVALFVVLVRPVCDAYGWQGSVGLPDQMIAAVHAIGEAAQHEHPGSCCASLEDAALAVTATAVTAAFKSPAAAIPAAVSLPGWRAPSRLFVVPVPPDRAPVLKPYYARSARILI